MAAIPSKIQNRLAEGLKKFQPILDSAKSRDVNESDTVVLLTGILSEALGYDKYTDITTELAIRGTYCDLALKIEGKIKILLEAKAIGIELKEAHVKQAVDYAANKGLDWVILSNGITWKIFKVVFSKPIQNILISDINFMSLKHKSSDDLEQLYLISKEGVAKESLENYFTQKQATNRFMIGNLLTDESVLNIVKKELKNLYPDIKVTTDEIKNVLVSEVIKREIFEGEESEDARKKIAKANKKKEKAKSDKKPNTPVISEVEEQTHSSEANTVIEN